MIRAWYNEALPDGYTVVSSLPRAGSVPVAWRVRHPLEIHDVAVYQYRTGLWRCEADPGERDCPHILAVQRHQNRTAPHGEAKKSRRT